MCHWQPSPIPENLAGPGLAENSCLPPASHSCPLGCVRLRGVASPLQFCSRLAGHTRQDAEDEVGRAARGLIILFHFPKTALGRDVGMFHTSSQKRRPASWRCGRYQGCECAIGNKGGWGGMTQRRHLPGDISGKVTEVTMGRCLDSSSRMRDPGDRDEHKGGLCLQQGITHLVPV